MDCSGCEADLGGGQLGVIGGLQGVQLCHSGLGCGQRIRSSSVQRHLSMLRLPCQLPRYLPLRGMTQHCNAYLRLGKRSLMLRRSSLRGLLQCRNALCSGVSACLRLACVDQRSRLSMRCKQLSQ